MRLVNKSKLPNKDIIEMIDFCARPLGIKTMTVKVYPTMYIDGDYGWSDPYKKEVSIAVGEKRTYPYLHREEEKRIIDSRDRWEKVIMDDNVSYWRKKPDYVDKYREIPHRTMLFLNYEEWMIHIIAHELRHQWQRKIRPMKEYTYTVRHLGSKSYFRRERDADVFAMTMVRQWRKSHALQVYHEQPDQIITDQK
jgi:hypothetical protein